jgi:hypothetical protein
MIKIEGEVTADGVRVAIGSIVLAEDPKGTATVPNVAGFIAWSIVRTS